MTDSFSSDEVSALKSIFNLYDVEGTGAIPVADVNSILRKIGYADEDVEALTEEAQQFGAQNDGRIFFDEFLQLLATRERQQPGEKTDPKKVQDKVLNVICKSTQKANANGPVLEFLRILEEYRVKCEEEGTYLEAERAHKQLDLLRTQEEKRQQRAIRARQLGERQDVQVAHSMQFTEFNQAWDRYMDEFDNMAQMYIQQMTERHAHNLLEFQRQLQREISDRPPKWSRELLEWRRRQHLMARQRNYTEAEKIRRIADKLEHKEKRLMEQGQATVFARKEAKFRQQQQAELQALLKRIEGRRNEHVKQRNLDCKRLLQRNRNVQVVLESKQTVETLKMFADIKKNLDGATTQGRNAGLGKDKSGSAPGAARSRTRTRELVAAAH